MVSGPVAEGLSSGCAVAADGGNGNHSKHPPDHRATEGLSSGRAEVGLDSPGIPFTICCGDHPTKNGFEPSNIASATRMIPFVMIVKSLLENTFHLGAARMD